MDSSINSNATSNDEELRRHLLPPMRADARLIIYREISVTTNVPLLLPPKEFHTVTLKFLGISIHPENLQYSADKDKSGRWTALIVSSMRIGNMEYFFGPR